MRLHPYAYDTFRLRSRGYLPHWEIDHSFYFITYRLADSLPSRAIQQLLEEQLRIRRSICGDREPTLIERAEIARLFGVALDRYLDAGHGACHLRNPEIASVVAENLRHFDGDRYELHAWCVMPNHVHVVIFLEHGRELSRVLHSWKSYTGKVAKRILGLSENFWQKEYFDRTIRDDEDLERTIIYTLENPLRAGLRNWKWVWRR